MVNNNQTERIIDLRSDTLTKPTAGMLQYMFQAQVGDDVFEEDPTIKKLESKLATLFNKQAGLFCPSGTMTNQIAIRINTVPQDEVICHKYAHVYLYEGGGMMSNSHVSVKLLDGHRGLLNAIDIEDAINDHNVHYPKSALVCLENTMNKGGGSCYPLEDLKTIRAVTLKHNLKLHLDGARIFNAIVAKGYGANEVGDCFDTISVCLSKGLGAPVGSVLLGDEQSIKMARRVRKAFGGGMRQAGYLAAAGLYALDHHINRLTTDHEHAQRIASTLEQLATVKKVEQVETNIIIFEPVHTINNLDYLKELESFGIKGHAFGKHAIRLVFHLDISEDQVSALDHILNKHFN